VLLFFLKNILGVGGGEVYCFQENGITRNALHCSVLFLSHPRSEGLAKLNCSCAAIHRLMLATL